MKTWGRTVIAAAWFAALVGLAQLGIGTATEAVRLQGVYDHMDFWSSQLVWLVWYAGLSVLAGTVAGVAAARRDTPSPGLGLRFSAALAASLGAIASIGTVLLQVRQARILSGNPLLIVGITVGVGAAIGLLAAIVVLSHKSFGWNAVSMIVAIWLVFGASAAFAPYDPPQLGVLGISGSTLGSKILPYALPMLAAAIGVVTGLIARSKGHHRAVLAISGSIGPALVGFAYAIAGPGTSDYQHRPWLAAMIAVGAGLLGSLVVGAWPQRSEAPSVVRPTRPDGTTTTAEIPIAERDTDYVGWVSGLTEPVEKPLPSRQRRSGGESSPRDTASATPAEAETAQREPLSRPYVRGRGPKHQKSS